MLIGWIMFDRMPLDANPQIMGRTAPTVLDLIVAVAVGVAGSFALVRRDVLDILAGVAIAISLVPVLAVVGITLGEGRWDLAKGALILFLTNAGAIIVAGIVVFTAAGYNLEAARSKAAARADEAAHRRDRGRPPLTPLAASSLRTYRYERWVGATDAAVRGWVAGTSWQALGTREVSGDIVAAVVGPGTPPPSATLEQAIRRTVPKGVTIKVIQTNGADITF